MRAKKTIDYKPLRKKVKIESSIVEELSDKRRKAAYVLAVNGWKPGDRASPSGTVCAAARAAGINRNTLWKWCKQEKFLDAVDEIKAEQITYFWQQLRKAADKLNVTAIIYSLKVLKIEHFDTDYRRQQLENEGRIEATKSLPQVTITPWSGPPPSPPPELENFIYVKKEENTKKIEQ